MKSKKTSNIALAIDLVQHEYKIDNPIIIAEKIHEDLGLEYSIHQIADYMDINRLEDYEKQSNKIEYEQNY